MKFKSIQLFVLTIGLSLAFVGCKRDEKEKNPTGQNSQNQASAVEPEKVVELSPEQKEIAQMIRSEDLIVLLMPQLNKLVKSWSGEAEFPANLFEKNFQLIGTPKEAALSNLDDVFQFGERELTSDTISDSKSIWSQFSKECQPVDASFGAVRGVFIDEDTFELKTKFECRLTGERAEGVKSTQTLTWVQNESGWKIQKWEQEKIASLVSNRPLFSDQTKSSLSDEEAYLTATKSPHMELLVERARKGNVGGYMAPPRMDYEFVGDWGSTYQFPAVSVVDFDNDGLDDLFITNRWGPSQLLKNTGGAFEDVTKQSGLSSVGDMASCSLFADFDNDGDQDVLIGRVLESCLFYWNDGGLFKPDKRINKQLQHAKFVVSGSIADINRDGLLDVYLCTYSLGNGLAWAKLVVPKKEQLDLSLKARSQHQYFDRAGPPNLLFMNRGDGFEKAELKEPFKQWRTTYQATWADFDSDGDQDLYVSNDFAPDAVFQNETEQGSFEPKFKEVTKELFPKETFAFSMGASWGDYNNDGDLDLYVSNMYSKAGNRVYNSLSDPDPRIEIAARGNFLFDNDNGKFSQVAGQGDQEQHVSIVGWSYGGQFADFDNDGWLDLYVPSGLYTAPDELDTQEDM